MAEQLALRVRPPAFGLPTGCPKCLPAFFYLRLSGSSFTPEYSLREPDADELPIAEIGSLAGFANECGGVEEFLAAEGIASLDSSLSSEQIAELPLLKASVRCLEIALGYELWCKENDSVVAQIYSSFIPWPVSKVTEWNMRRKFMNSVAITRSNAAEVSAQIYKDAFEQYDALSAKLVRGHKYFLGDRPTSLDAVLAAHLLFLLSAPLENSALKEGLMLRPYLVEYAEKLRGELLTDSGETGSAKAPKPSFTAHTSSSSSSARSSGSNPKGRKPTSKEVQFKKKAKQFVLAQIAAVVLYVLVMSIQVEDDDVGDTDE